MLSRSRAALVFSSTVLLLACGGGEGPGAGGSGTTTSTGTGTGTGSGAAAGSLPCEVDKVVAENCRQCHGATPSFGAPMPLVTYADLHAPAKSDAAKKVYELVGTRIHDAQKPMPQPPNPPLDAAEQKVLDDWIAAGAPSSSESCGTGGAGTGGTGTGGGAPSCNPDVTLHPQSKFTMPTDATDVYVCYGVDVTVSAKRHITTFLPYIDNPKIVHHIVLFQADTSQPAGPVVCGFGSTSRIVAVWAPGNAGFELPPAAGLPLEGTAHYMLQVHYNNLQHLTGETDGSGFDLCTTDQLRPNDADVLAFGTEKFTVPAHGSLDVTCEFKIPANSGTYHIMGAMPHMHKLGTVIETKTLPGGAGAPVDVGSRNPWDFETQYWTPLDVVVQSGDTVKTRCAWNNPGSQPVKFGEGTGDEMCFTFELYYPKISLPGWNWSVPSLLSQCAPTP